MVAVIPDSQPHGLSDAEHQRIVHTWNDTRREFPHLCAHELFEQQAARTPDALALRFADQHMTYRELNERANQVAHCLRRRCAGPESLVGVCLSRSPALVVALLGVWKAGAAYVPLDPTYPPERLAFMVGDAELPLLLVDGQSRPLLADQSGEVICLDSDWAMIAQENSDNPTSPVSPDNLAYVMYTSGSTGQPKGAMIEHSGLVNYLCWAIEAYGLDEASTVPVHSSIAFDLTVTSLYPPLLVGGQVELLPEDAGAQNLLASLRQAPHSLVKITPAHLELLASQLAPDELARISQAFVIGGESLLAESLRPWRRHAPQSRLINEYGPTETVVGCCIHEVQPDDPDSGPLPIGRPIANTRLYVLDETMQPLPPGITGELYIGGVGVARGYLNRPELTGQRFLADPFAGDPQARLYRSGDLARYRPDGLLEYLGRTDRQVKLRGYRIELGEIEGGLAAHPGIRACAVIVREDEPGNRQLLAYVVFAPESTSTADELQDFLKQRLPDYMLPAHFVRLDALPLTANGKVDHPALPAPSAANVLPADQFVAPRNEGERKLAAIWRELLKLERIGIHDDFFDFGGHSLLAIRAVSRIRDVFGVDMKIQTLFDHPTIAALASILDETGGNSGQLARIEVRRDSGPSPLSFAQEHLWFMDQLAPGNPVYNIVEMIPLAGAYHPMALERALNELVRRHEILRTVFFEHHGQAVQIVLPSLDLALAELDLSAQAMPEQAAAWQRLVHQHGRHAFVLSQAPLWHWLIVHLSGQEHRLLLCMHHIVADEWAMERMQQEIRQLYAAFSQGRPSPLSELPIQYADFACWQRDWLRGDRLAREIAYWQAELAGAPQVLELPTDHPRPAVPSFCGALERFTVPKALAEQLKALGRHEQATLFMVLETAFMALLHRYTGQDDILLGTPISGRTHSETERLIGYFLNILVLRARFSEGLSFRHLLQQTRSQALAAYAHAELPFQRLVAELAPVREPGRSPLFQVMFVLHDGAGTAPASHLSEHQELAIGTAKFDLTLLFTDTGDALEGAIEYSTDLFEPATMHRLAGHCLTLLAAIVANPDQAIDHLPLLTSSERRQLLVDWNDTTVDYPADALLHQLFVAQAARTPEAIAVICEEQQLSYRELDTRSNQLARHLQQRGVGPDQLVAVYAERSLEMVVALLGILKAGGAYLPIDPDYPVARVAGILDEAQPPVVLSQSHLRPQLPAAAPVLCLDSDWAAVAGASAAPVASAVSAGNVAYAIYTSGSTGRPKGILIPHASICNHMFWLQRTHPLSPEDALLQKTPFGFDASVWEFFAPLLAGAQLVMARPGGHLDPAYLAETIRRHNITLLQLVPSLLRMLLAEPAFGRCAPPLRQVFCGGEELSAELAAEFHRRLPQVRLSNLYGPSETTIDATCLDLAVDDKTGPISIGRPIDNVRTYIVSRQMELTPIGVPGELLIGGNGLARGYLRQPELSADKFIADPFRDEAGARLYKTGDLTRYRPDGSIEFLGRLDHQVKVRGFRIELGEIETCLARHPAIRQAVVVTRDDASATRQLVAYLVAEQPPDDLVDQLRTLLRNTLPEYMVPASFVRLDALPLTHSGKIDRQALPAPVHDDSARTARAVNPRTASESLILEMFRDVLGRADFGIFDNFFDLGGHSIMAAQLMARLQDESGLRLPLRHLFERPTVAGLAEIVDGLNWLARTKTPATHASAREEIEL